MDFVTERVSTPRVPWRALGALALIALLIATAVAAYVGSQARLPAPFGVARNGLIAYDADGDIFAADPETGATKAIVAGPETDRAPVLSRDGTRVAFERKAVGAGLLFVAQVDGGGIVQITPEPLIGLSAWSFSPDGRSIVALATIDSQVRIVIATSDGVGEPRVLAARVTADDGAPEFRPPDGSEILFIGRDPGQANRGVYAVNPVTAEVRTIVAPSDLDVYAATWSPDGSRIAYGLLGMTEGPSTQTHVVSADGSGDFRVDDHPVAIADGTPMAWSNDGTRLIITRIYSVSGDQTRSAIVPVDGSGLGIEMDCPPTVLGEGCAVDWTWSPDDGLLLGTVSVADNPPQQMLADPLTGTVTPLPWTTDSLPAWQRVAP